MALASWGALAKLESHFLLSLWCFDAIPVSQDKNSVAGHFITKMIISTSKYHFDIQMIISVTKQSLGVMDRLSWYTLYVHQNDHFDEKHRSKWSFWCRTFSLQQIGANYLRVFEESHSFHLGCSLGVSGMAHENFFPKKCWNADIS
jgi:hypothetical protein